MKDRVQKVHKKNIQKKVIMVTTKVDRSLLGQMNPMDDEIISVNEEEISSSSLTTSSSSTRDTVTSMINNMVKFKKHIKKICIIKKFN